MNNYRLTLIVKDSVDEKERQALLDDVVKSFGELKKADMWGSRAFTYKIAHDTKGYYAHYEFSSAPETISALDKKLKLNEDILRYLLLKHEPRAIKKIRKAASSEETISKQAEEAKKA